MHELDISRATLRVLLSIARLAEAEGYPPSLREISEDVGVVWSVVAHHVRALEEAGAIRRKSGKQARSIVITPTGRAYIDGYKAGLESMQ